MIPGITYLAYPIDKAGESDSARLAGRALALLRGRSEVVYDPGAAFTISKDATVAAVVRDINNWALTNSVALLALVPDGVPTWGVPAEIERAVMLGLQVAIVTDRDPTWSMAYSDDNVRVFQISESDHPVSWTYQTLQAVMWLRGQFLASEGADATYIPQTPHEFEEEPDEYLPDTLPVMRMPDIPEHYVSLPARGYPDDAGLDLFVVGDHRLEPGQFKDISCGVAVELPEGTWGLLVGRSSTLRKKRLLVSLGVIDVGYRGELFAGVQNLGHGPVSIKHGERVAQLIVLPNLTATLTPRWVDELNQHDRGTNGFGSTGS